MENYQHIIEFIIAIIVGFGGWEGGKIIVRKVRNRNNSQNNEFDQIETTNPGQDMPMMQSEYRIKNFEIGEKLKSLDEKLTEIQPDIKKISESQINIQIDLQKMKGDISTQLARTEAQIQTKVDHAIDRHELRFHKVA